jgi:hypothetical protein
MNTIQLTEKVSGFSERDLHSKALLNTDTDAHKRYKLQKQRALRDTQSSEDIVSMKQELSCLKNDLNCIKEMLLKITKEGK